MIYLSYNGKMNSLKQFFQNMYQKTHFWKRFITCSIAIFIMGLCVSILILVNMGTDPCTTMNLGISQTIHMSFGNWSALFNIAVFILVVIFDKKQIGFGTILNMFGIGYVADIFRQIWHILIPNGLPDILLLKSITMIVTLMAFVLAAALYMTVDLGTSPYDALPLIIHAKLSKINFRWIRITFDVSAIIIGILFGATIGIVTLAMAFALGPVISWMQVKVQKVFA